jgi:P pilus assembly chaperone PapD
MKIAVLALALMCLALPAHASMDCNDIRAIVKMVGKEKAIQIARKGGASEQAIREAAECLKH